MKAAEDLMKQQRHIEVCLSNHSDQARIDYRIRLIASIDCIRFLLKQGFALSGHNESKDSFNRGNFLELLQFLAKHNEEVNKVVLKNALENLKLKSHKIQCDIVNSIVTETTNAIIRKIGDQSFSILVDEACDISINEQMVVALRFVDDRGFLMERFLGIVHVTDTTALSLKAAIEYLLLKYGYSLSSIRGQGYNGASNMRGEFNGLKSLILMENNSTYYMYCFAHQLQLTLETVAENHSKISTFFDIVTMLSNIIGASCKRRDILREKQYEKMIEGIYSGEILTGSGLNQEKTLKRARSTRWGSHFGTLVSLIDLLSSVIDVLIIIGDDGHEAKQRAKADNLSENIQVVEFAFILHLMKNVLGITNDLSLVLQKKDQDIVNAMALVRTTKLRLQKLRDDGWESLLNMVSLFCIKHKIIILNMEDPFVK